MSGEEDYGVVFKRRLVDFNTKYGRALEDMLWDFTKTNPSTGVDTMVIISSLRVLVWQNERLRNENERLQTQIDHQPAEIKRLRKENESRGIAGAPDDECAECMCPRSLHKHDFAGIPFCGCTKYMGHDFKPKKGPDSSAPNTPYTSRVSAGHEKNSGGEPGNPADETAKPNTKRGDGTAGAPENCIGCVFLHNARCWIGVLPDSPICFKNFKNELHPVGCGCTECGLTRLTVERATVAAKAERCCCSGCSRDPAKTRVPCNHFPGPADFIDPAYRCEHRTPSKHPDSPDVSTPKFPQTGAGETPAIGSIPDQIVLRDGKADATAQWQMRDNRGKWRRLRKRVEK